MNYSLFSCYSCSTIIEKEIFILPCCLSLICSKCLNDKKQNKLIFNCEICFQIIDNLSLIKRSFFLEKFICESNKNLPNSSTNNFSCEKCKKKDDLKKCLDCQNTIFL